MVDEYVELLVYVEQELPVHNGPGLLAVALVGLVIDRYHVVGPYVFAPEFLRVLFHKPYPFIISLSRKASTTSGSNCDPLHLTISSLATSSPSACLYGLVEVMASKVSATLNILATSGISQPARPLGSPWPSHPS